MLVPLHGKTKYLPMSNRSLRNCKLLLALWTQRHVTTKYIWVQKPGCHVLLLSILYIVDTSAPSKNTGIVTVEKLFFNILPKYKKIMYIIKAQFNVTSISFKEFNFYWAWHQRFKFNYIQHFVSHIFFFYEMRSVLYITRAHLSLWAPGEVKMADTSLLNCSKPLQKPSASFSLSWDCYQVSSENGPLQSFGSFCGTIICP